LSFSATHEPRLALPATIGGALSIGAEEEGSMMRIERRFVVVVAVAATLAGIPRPGGAESAEEIHRSASAALEQLLASTPAAKTLAAEAKGILVFPTVAKAGFMYGGEYGNGALRKHGKVAGYYNLAEVSYGFQAGIEKFSYALFFMTEDALAYLDKTGGFAVGAGPSLTVVDTGFATNLTTTTVRDDVYAFVWGEQGLMGGISLKGSKITRIHPD
jgi:lipid-binding SYLF domain-containing protein